MKNFSPNLCHDFVLRTQSPLLAFDPSNNYLNWKEAVREKILSLMGVEPIATDPDFRIEWERETDDYVGRRFVFDTEPEASVPCHLLVPKNGKKKYPLIVCLQGHYSGMHLSMGRALNEQDADIIASTENDFALQAINKGCAALCVEQRGFGERKSEITRDEMGNTTCYFASMNALLIGRTILRERAWDVSRAIDVMDNFPEIDTERIGVVGLSGGGTVAYYTACLEPRIKAVMPACAVCSFDKSISMHRHCACNYIPDMARYMDMGEVACMIVPRPLIVVAGEQDTGFRIEGVKKVYRVIKQIYEKEGAPENCRLIIGPEGHKFYPALSWDVFLKSFL